ncbi:hypothetical protein D9613_008020 [Agrocybe pediades]|uniref:Uncharacterized protein n=1 Tax=Agrocybe pediades TaxID=84607 RepID=A0A8H4QNJ6_9AGAR|nr:hypothetical protein D9613_008020 [Agrocybe pediades]
MTYIGHDYPETWPILRKSVLLQFDNPRHFRLDTEDGAAEWGALSPENGVIHLGPNRRPFTVAMMHQLKCMDVIRYEMVRERGPESDYRGPSPLRRHCLNYLRQMITCHGDLELEAFQFATHKNPVDWRGVYECKDWEAVYNAVEINQKEYRAWLKEKNSE